MNIERITALQCKDCGTISQLETKECECEGATLETIDAYYCKECGRVYDCKVAASECCERPHFQSKLRNNY